MAFRQNPEQFGGVNSVKGAGRRRELQAEGRAHLKVLREELVGNYQSPENRGEAGASQGWRCRHRLGHAGAFVPH